MHKKVNLTFIGFFKKFHWVIICLIFAVACKNTGEKTPPNDVKEKQFSFLKNNTHINRTMDSLVENGLLPFLYARIENHNGETIFEHSAVNEELYPGLEVNKDSWFRIWSMSKIVTISLTMNLVEDGILDIHEPVSKYIPEFKKLKVALAADNTPITDAPWDKREGICPLKYVPAETEMTIYHLINHQAGFYYPWTEIECLDNIWKEQDLNKANNSQELIDLLKDMPLVQQPGTTYYYGLNTTVLGLVAERATGNSLKQLVEDRITKPLKIEGLQYSKPANVNLLPRTNGGEKLVKVNAENENDILGAKLPDYSPNRSLFLGGEGMLGTTDGYADFMRMLLHRGILNGHRLLENATIEEMSSPHTQKDSPWGYNGYNLWVTGDTLRAMGIGEAGFWVSGGYEGTYCWIDRKRKFIGLVMTQMFNMKTAPGEDIRGAVYQEIWKQKK